MLTVTNHPPAVQQHATTVALVTAAALAGSLATAYIFTRSSPVSLLSKGRKWWARLQVTQTHSTDDQSMILVELQFPVCCLHQQVRHTSAPNPCKHFVHIGAQYKQVAIFNEQRQPTITPVFCSAMLRCSSMNRMRASLGRQAAFQDPQSAGHSALYKSC